MTISYEYGGGLYINLTNRCDCDCVFCLRHHPSRGSIYADNLWLEREPTRQEALDNLLARDLASYSELVFCGFGEPMYQVFDIVWLIDRLKQSVSRLPPVRIDTNGHANLIHGQDVTPLLKGRVDVLSVSLNASTAEGYVALTRPQAGEAAWEAMLDFVKKALVYVPSVVLTVVDRNLSPQELEACRTLAQSLQASLRVRAYIPD